MDDQDDTQLDPELAVAMGFSGFGNQANSKKRKYNYNDAVIDRATTGNKTGGRSTGANATQLGIRPASSAATAMENEKGLEQAGPGSLKQLAVADDAVPQTNSAMLEGEKTTLDQDISVSTYANSKVKAKKLGSTGLAQFLERGNEVKPEPSAAERSEQQQDSSRILPSHSSPPPKPQELVGPGRITHEDLQALRRGVRNEQGDIAYYLPSFVEDPWKDL